MAIDKLTEALKGILPADQVSEVHQVLTTMVSEEAARVEADFKAKLEEAYEQFEADKEAAKAAGYKGYEQAYEVIMHQQKQMDLMKAELTSEMHSGFEEALKDLNAEKEKNKTLAADLYGEYEKKLEEMKEFMVDKVDQFLALQEAEIYESAKRQILNDPRMMEHKVALDRVAEILGGFMSNETYSSVTSHKLDDAQRRINDLAAHVKQLESKNVRLTMTNNKLAESANKLGEQLSEANKLVTEAAETNRKERASKAQNASGRGQRAVSGTERIIAEFNNPAAPSTNDTVLSEGRDEMDDFMILSGLVTPE